MSDQAEGLVTALCVRAGEESPPVPSHKEACARCGLDVWVEDALQHDRAICTSCASLVVPLDAPVILHPTQIAALRRVGFSDRRIARAFAEALAHMRRERLGIN